MAKLYKLQSIADGKLRTHRGTYSQAEAQEWLSASVDFLRVIHHFESIAREDEKIIAKKYKNGQLQKTVIKQIVII